MDQITYSRYTCRPMWCDVVSEGKVNWPYTLLAELAPSPKTPSYNQTWNGSEDRLRRYNLLKFFQDGGGRHLGFVRTGNIAIRFAIPENPTLEPTKYEVDRMIRCGDMAIRIFWYERSVVGRSLIGRQCTPLRYFKKVAKRSKNQLDFVKLSPWTNSSCALLKLINFCA